MINATETVLLLKKSNDPETRRPIYSVRRLDGCSVHEALSDQTMGGLSSRDNIKKRVVNIRVPDVSAYVGEAEFARLSKPADKWCVTLQDSVIILETEPAAIPAAMYEAEANELAARYGLHAKVYRVCEYADNSRRGTDRVKHIRIVGE